MESRVAIAIGHIDYMLQQHRRHLRKCHQVVRDPRRLSHLGTGNAEPLELDSVAAGELKVRAYVVNFLICCLVYKISANGSKTLELKLESKNLEFIKQIIKY